MLKIIIVDMKIFLLINFLGLQIVQKLFLIVIFFSVNLGKSRFLSLKKISVFTEKSRFFFFKTSFHHWFTYHLTTADFNQKPKENKEPKSFVNTSTCFAQ